MENRIKSVETDIEGTIRETREEVENLRRCNQEMQTRKHYRLHKYSKKRILGLENIPHLEKIFIEMDWLVSDYLCIMDAIFSKN